MDSSPSNIDAAPRQQTVSLTPDTWVPAKSTAHLPVARVGGENPDFEVKRVIARGGMGIVELARQGSLGREVALKRLVNPNDEAGLQALLREAKITARLEHPGIVSVHGIFQDAKLGPLVVMECLDGATWRSKIHDGLDLRDHVKIAIEVCYALEYAHNHGVLHLDVKPDNVIVGEYGQVCLLDWGIVLDLLNAPGRDEALGTPTYMAPEMADPGSVPLSERADVYLVGGCLYEAIYGMPPHDRAIGPARSNGVFFPEDSIGQPSELVGICRRALAPHPDSRFASVRQIRVALEGFLEHQYNERLVAQVFPDILSATDHLPTLHALDVRLQSALSLWPESPRGRMAEQVLLPKLLAVHIAADDVAEAERTAARMTTVPDDLAEGLATLRTRSDDFHRHMRDSSALQNTGRPMRAILWIASFGCVAAVFLPWQASSPTASMFITMLLGLSVWLASIAVFRDRYFATHASRTTSLVVTLTLFGVLLNRLHGMTIGSEASDVARIDMLVAAAVLGSQVLLHRVFVHVALVMAVGYLGSLVVPVFTVPIMHVAFWGSTLLVLRQRQNLGFRVP